MITDNLLEGSPMKLKNPVALVTGASSGIGKATAERLAMVGYKVYGTSRRAATRRIKEMIDVVARYWPDQGEPRVYEHALVTVATMVGTLVLARAVDDPTLAEALRAASVKHCDPPST